MSKKVSVIIPTMPERGDLLARLVDSIPDNYEIITVLDQDLLLAGKRNKGAHMATGDYLLFIDDDNYLAADAINLMVENMHESIGVMGMVACYDDKRWTIADGGSRRHLISGFTDGLFTNCSIFDVVGVYNVCEVANAFMIKRDIFYELGGFDEKYFPIDLDEADLCMRMRRAGLRVVMNPKAICYHKSQTYSRIPDFRRPMNAFFMGRNRVFFQFKHLNSIQLIVYLSLFMPVFYMSYVLSLLYRRKPMMIYHFTKGVLNGIFGRTKNKYQSQTS